MSIVIIAMVVITILMMTNDDRFDGGTFGNNYNVSYYLMPLYYSSKQAGSGK